MPRTVLRRVAGAAQALLGVALTVGGLSMAATAGHAAAPAGTIRATVRVNEVMVLSADPVTGLPVVASNAPTAPTVAVSSAAGSVNWTAYQP